MSPTERTKPKWKVISDKKQQDSERQVVMTSVSLCTDNPQILPKNNLIKDQHTSHFLPINYPKKKNLINTATLNIQSIMAKQAQFQSFIDDYHLIFRTESWLSPKVLSSKIFPLSYNVFR